MRISLTLRAARQALVTAALGLAACMAGAASPELVPVLDACRKIRADAERLACYDRVVGGLTERVLTSVSEGAADPAGAPQTDEQRFGYKNIREREELAAERKGVGLKELVATVTSVSRRANGAHVVTLDNGQVWAEKSLEPFFRVSAGDRVRIRPAALGSFLLSTSENRSTRVTRVQ